MNLSGGVGVCPGWPLGEVRRRLGGGPVTLSREAVSSPLRVPAQPHPPSLPHPSTSSYSDAMATEYKGSLAPKKKAE